MSNDSKLYKHTHTQIITMIVNLASGRGTSRIIKQKNRLLHRNLFQRALLEQAKARMRKRDVARSKLLQVRNKKQNLANRYALLSREAEQLAHKVMAVGDARRGRPKNEGPASKADVLKILNTVKSHCCVDLEGRKLATIIEQISKDCPETNEVSQATISQLETANLALLEAKEFLGVALEKEEEIIETYELVEHYGNVVAEVVDAYNALDVLEEMAQKEVKIELSGREKPVGKEAIFRLFRQRMVGTIEDLKNSAGEIYEQRIHTITVGEWEDMLQAAKEGVGAKTGESLPSNEEITQAFKEALLVRNTFVFAARELYTKMGGKTRAIEPMEGNVVPIDFAKREKL